MMDVIISIFVGAAALIGWIVGFAMGVDARALWRNGGHS